MTTPSARPVLVMALPPRGLSREDAAAYCGIDAATFDDWRRQGIVPGPMAGTRRWDRRAIDRALDQRSGLSDHTQPADPIAGEDEWLARIRG